MKKGILFIAALLVGFSAKAQVIAGSVTMGPSYANQVYYKLSNQTTNAYPHASWDIAFLRTSSFGFATRINDARNIEVYESGNTASWATTDVTQIANWTRLYNSETQWDLGAFDNGSATYGWGEYNPGNHHVTGAVVFVLKYANGTFRKFKIDDFFGGYTFTYATWSGSAWSADQTVVLANAANPTNKFNYYSLENNAAVVAEPASADWDLTFTKYKTDYFGDGSMWQDVTGVLHHPDMQVAERVEPAGVPGSISGLTYVEDINTIGYDWKTFNMSNFTYTVQTDKAFYVKYPSGTVYRLAFETFVGSSTGVITFNHQDVTSLLGSETFDNSNTFGVYPNPSVDKKINVVYDLKSADKNSVAVYNLTGAKVYERQLAGQTGFFTQEMDLGQLNSGVYILQLQSGNQSATKKIVLQ